jgi:DNA end-binding protein Ku
LLDALRDTNKVAIARVVLRQKEYLTAIRAAGDVLTMETMLFADELVPPERLDELPDDDVSATDRELAMARQLIESQASDFDPGKYRDEYRERVLDLIERKAQGQDVAVQPEAEQPTEVPDLMAALEASLAAATDRKPARKPVKKPAAKKPAAKKPAKATNGGAPAKKRPARSKKTKASARS